MDGREGGAAGYAGAGGGGWEGIWAGGDEGVCACRVAAAAALVDEAERSGAVVAENAAVAGLVIALVFGESSTRAHIDASLRD